MNRNESLPTEKEWVGRCVRHWRNHYGLQQSDVAAVMTNHLGVKWTQGVVANIEAGRRSLSLYELLALCMVFAVSLDALLYPPVDEYAPGADQPVPLMIRTPDGERCASPLALGEALEHGWDAELVDAWSLSWPGMVKPSDVIEARDQYLPDPEFQAIQAATHITDPDRLQAVVDRAYRDAYRGRRKAPYTATDLVDAVEADMRAEQPSKKYETEHAQRTLRHHARRRAADLVIRKVMTDL